MSDLPEAPTPSVLLIGGPDAGKSNFLFRFWFAVDSGTGALVKDRFPDELEYLRTGLESLLRGEFAGRTSKEVLEHVTIPVKSAHEQQQTGILNVPDVPGEKILEVYRLRRWAKLWEDRIREGCGCLVFIRADSDEVVRPLDYAECISLFGNTLPEEPTPPGATDNPQSSQPVTKVRSAMHPPRSDAPQSAMPAASAATSTVSPEPPTDVVLVDWMQFLRRAFTDRVSGSYRPRIGIVIAAWDAVPNDAQNQPPVDYLDANFPLLRQFIETNDDRFDFQVFGLSILGGDLRKNAEFLAKFKKGKPNEFGYVIHSIGGPLVKVHDTTLPVAWALGWFPPDSTLEAST